MIRRIGADIPNAGEDDATTWGLGLTGHYNVFERDKLVFSGLYGEGLGRIQSTAGSVLDPMNFDYYNVGSPWLDQTRWASRLDSFLTLN